MEVAELQSVNKCLQNFPKLPLWIIEYVWAHKMMDIPEVVDSSNWPEIDSQPLSLEDSWRLRVAAAQVYSIMKNRDVEHFERAMGFLEATYRLLPRLVTPIKHMKIMFGLKTMVITWMFREGRGMVDTLFKINQFFPSKLPQYQDQCSQHEMFLMRKNHLDFKALAQALAMDQDKLKDYIENQMEEQYGEHYAQKVEDRLLHFLHKLETVLPGDTYIDKILKKESPVTEEEKLLLEVITSDSTTIAATLKNLLHCDVASCRPSRVSQSSEHEMETTPLSELYDTSSKALLTSVEAKTPLELKPEVSIRGEDSDQDVSKGSSFLLENDDYSDVSRQTERGGDVVKRVGEERRKEEISQRSSERVQEAASSPQFCSKHQRWVENILQQCPDECSEELLLQAKVSSSPPLFQSSSSTSSSQDLTPSDLIPCPPDKQHPPSHSTQLQTVTQASEQANLKDKPGSGSANDTTSQAESLRLPASSRETLPPVLMSPVVRLIDIAFVRQIYPPFVPQQASPNHLTMSSKKQAASASSLQLLTSPHRHTSGDDGVPQRTTTDSPTDQRETVSPTNPPNTTHKVQTAAALKDASTSTSCQPPTRQSFSRLSRKFTQARTTVTHSQAPGGFTQNLLAEQLKSSPATFQTSCTPLPDDFNVAGPKEDASTSGSQSGSLSPQNSIEPHPQKHNISPVQSTTLQCSTVVSSISNSNCLAVGAQTSRASRAQLRLSLPSQAVLLESQLLQPCVSLTRLSTQQCFRATKGRSSTGRVEPVVQSSNHYNCQGKMEEEEDDADSSFDVNILYSSHSSISDGEDSLDLDPDYKPCISKRRLLLEYETARNLNHI